MSASPERLPIDARARVAQSRRMESYSLLILFAAMVVIWWFSWSPWRKDPPDSTQADDDAPEDRKTP